MLIDEVNMDKKHVVLRLT